MSRTWNEAQKAAINGRGGQILVSAAAGSGKTSVLVERALRLITGETPIPADRMLIITFTNAAAAELKSRLYSALDRLCAEQPRNQLFREQRLAVRRAEIGTIHSFCGHLISENFQEVDIPPDYRIGHASLMNELSGQAMNAALETLYAENSDFRSLSALFGRAGNDGDVVELVLKLHDVLSAQPDAVEYRRRCLKPFSQSFGDTVFCRQLSDNACELLRATVALCEAAASECRLDKLLTDRYLPSIEALNTAARMVISLLNDGRFAEAVAYVKRFEYIRLGQIRGDKPAATEYVKTLYARAKDSFFGPARDNCLDIDPESYANECDFLRGPLNALFDAEELFDANYTAIKIEKKLFEFSDLERYAIRLLYDKNGDTTEIARRTAARIECVMVDEYQDTNEIQNAIFRAVCRDNLSNLFVVGDVKQSIYGFRNADTDIIIELERRCLPLGRGYPALVRLNENYRSTAEVADAVNALFDVVLTEKTGNVDYKNNQRLICGSGTHTSDGIGLELAIVEDGDLDAQAAYVADRIQNLVESGYEINDGEGGLRPVGYADFAVLLRAPSTRAANFVAAFDNRGIPCSAADKNDFFAQREIAELVSALEAVNNPQRDVELASLLLSSRFSFTPDELLAMRNSDRRANLYSLLKNGSGGEKAAEALNFLKKMRAVSTRLALDDFVTLMVRELSLEYLAPARPDGERRLQNVRAFVEYAAELRASLGISLPGFLRVLRRAKADGKAPDSAVGLAKNSVVVTSIHKAKGLEWPVVFLACADSRYNTEDLRKPVMYSPRLGLGVKYIDNSGELRRNVNTASRAAVRLQEKARQSAEELRMFYVALTRARDKAVIVANTPSDTFTGGLGEISEILDGETIAALCNSYLELTVTALVVSRRVTCRTISAQCEKTADGIRISRIAAGDAVESVAVQPELPAPDLSAVSELRGRFEYVYPRAALCEVPAKLSVSELTKQDGEPSVRRPSFAALGGMSAAEKGTAIHEFMQYADYRLATMSVANEIERLVELRYIDDATASGIDIAALERLFAGELMANIMSCKRVLREYEFFIELDAGLVSPGLKAGEAKVMVQGIADCVCVYDDGAVIIDYKSDRVNSAAELAERYSGQLAVYKRAVELRLGVPVKRCGLYSFALGVEVAVNV